MATHASSQTTMDQTTAGPVTPGAVKAGLSIDDLRSAAEETSRARGEPDWLRGLREEALSAYASLPLPDRVGHLWRYSDPERFLPTALPTPAGGRTRDRASGGKAEGDWPAEIAGPLGAGELAGAALVRGGRLVRASLDGAGAIDGRGAGKPLVEELHQAAVARAELVRRHLFSAVPPGMGKFEALNAALWRGGLLVHVPRGVEVRKPLHLLTVVDGGLELPRLLVVLEPDSSLTLVDEYTGGGEGTQVQAVVELVVSPSARLRYVAVQRLAGGGPALGRGAGRGPVLHFSKRSRLAQDAREVSLLASLGGTIAKADLGTFLEGRGAEVELLAFLFGQGRQHFDHHTVHDHRCGHTRSNLDFKVVLKDRARSAYTGLIRIAHDAPTSEAYQENRNLLLSDGAKADSIPELEILTDEVMCTHGATMGSLDPEHLFYLASRGIPRAEATRMIVAGFVEPTLNRVPEDLRDRLRALVDEGLRTI